MRTRHESTVKYFNAKGENNSRPGRRRVSKAHSKLHIPQIAYFVIILLPQSHYLESPTSELVSAGRQFHEQLAG